MREPVEALRPGVVRIVIVAWRLDDPGAQDDARFWMKIREETAAAFKQPVGTIVPKGQTLRAWRAQAEGDEVDVLNPITRGRARFALTRWSDEDPDRTHVILSFQHFGEDRAGGRLPLGATPIDLKLSDEAQQLRSEQAELQGRCRAARDCDDEQQMRELRPLLEAKGDALTRAAFPDFARGWDLGRAVREAPDRFVLDWRTGY